MPARRTRPNILLTGFAPFEGAASNPSWQAASRLHGRQIAGHRVVARELPTEFDTSLTALRAAIRATRPKLVLCTGLASNRSCLSLERIAINIDDARIADNAGKRPIDRPVIATGPAAYFSTVPIKAMLLALHEAGIPAEVSQTAGTFVCNHVFYGLMHALRRKPAIRAGFVHVPPPVEDQRHPGQGMSLDTITEGLRIALHRALTTEADLRIAAGAED